MSTVLITGGHGGIGFQAAKELASHKVELVLAGRSPDRMAHAALQLEQLGSPKVTLLALDTSSLQSVREAAARVEGPLHAIVCNAGGRFDRLEYTPDGYELTFATNCLGHWLLVELLVDRLSSNGRVVFTASGTHDPDTVDGRLVGKVVTPDAVALANTGKNGASPIAAGKRYSTSKLVNVMHAYELARRLQASGSTIASIAYDPGAVPDSGFLRQMPGPVRWLASSAFMKWLTHRIGVTPGDLVFSGASLARLAVDPTYEHASGKYFQSNALRLIETRSSTLSYNAELALKLWDDTRHLAHLQPNEEPALLR